MSDLQLFIICAAVVNVVALFKVDNGFFFVLLWAATAGAYEMLFK
jgi:hypothetical protein